jgi:uncharacterized protein YpmB
MKSMRRRILWFSLFAAVTAAILFARFYYGVQHVQWQDRNDAKQIAAAEAGLVQIDRVDSYSGDGAYQVVTGSNSQGEKMLVWLSSDDKHVEKASAGITAEQATAALLARSPGVEVQRAVPGKFRGEYVWELFYKRREDGGDRYLYDYVKFTDGAYMDTYRLSLK